MPQYPHRPIVQAVDRLTAQARRIADHLDTPAEETDAPLPPDNGARIVPRVMPPGAEEHAQAFQQWLHDNTPKPWPPYKQCSASITGAYGSSLGPCVLRYQHDGPVHQNPDGTTWANSRAEDGDTDALNRVIDVIHQYEEWHLAGHTACQPIDVARQLRAAVDGKRTP